MKQLAKIGFFDVLGILVLLVVTLWCVLTFLVLSSNAFGEELPAVTRLECGLQSHTPLSASMKMKELPGELDAYVYHTKEVLL
jgi:hypothetical protein